MNRIHRWYKKNLNDITILLSFLLICGISLGLLAQVKRTHTTPKTLSVPEFLLYIHPFILSGGVERIVDLMQTLPVQDIHQILHYIIPTQEGSLTNEDKVKLVVQLAYLLQDSTFQREVLAFLLEYKELLETFYPLLYTLVQSPVSRNSIPQVLSWLKEEKGEETTKQMIQQALDFAITSNNVDSFSELLFFTIPFSEKQAQALLWKVVEGDKDPAFVDLLAQYTPIDISNETHTPLMLAVERGNMPLITKLLAHNADPNKVVDNATGSSLQISLIKQDEAGPQLSTYVEIEQLLRSAGARERIP